MTGPRYRAIISPNRSRPSRAIAGLRMPRSLLVPVARAGRLQGRGTRPRGRPEPTRAATSPPLLLLLRNSGKRLVGYGRRVVSRTCRGGVAFNPAGECGSVADRPSAACRRGRAQCSWRRTVVGLTRWAAAMSAGLMPPRVSSTHARTRGGSPAAAGIEPRESSEDPDQRILGQIFCRVPVDLARKELGEHGPQPTQQRFDRAGLALLRHPHCWLELCIVRPGLNVVS